MSAIIPPTVRQAQTATISRGLRRRQWLSLAGATLLFGLLAWRLPGADRLERELCLPWLFAQHAPQQAPAEAVIIAIDGASAVRLGLPARVGDWPRHIYADLIRRAADSGADVIAVDVFFAQARDSADDAALATAIAHAGNVVLFGQMERNVQGLSGANTDGQVQVDRLRRPHTLFAAAAAAVAPFVLPKAPMRVDTVWTHHPATPTLPTLPAAAVMVQAGQHNCPVDTEDATPAQQAACELRFGARERMLNFYGPPRSFQIVSAADVLLGAPLDLHGRAVFIGHVEPYYPNQQDSFFTAVSRPDGLDLSGVEIASTAYVNLLRRDFLQPAPPLAVASGLLVGALVLSAAYLPLAVPAAGMFTLALGVAVCFGVLAAFEWLHIWLPLAPWLVELAAVLLGSVALRARQSGRERAQVAAAFRHYLPAHLVEHVAQSSGDGFQAAAPRLMHAVCLVSDATGYTALAERLAATDLSALVNRYYATLLAPIRAEGGVVTDIVGDSALAVWPTGHAALAQQLRACRAAVNIQEALAALAAREGGGLPTRIGLHAGELVLGPVGALDHYEYRAIGDTVNAASRIEALNKRLGTQILASQAVVGELSGICRRRVGRFRLPGKSDVLVLYQLIGRQSVDQIAAWPLFEAALTAFDEGFAMTAGRGFRAVLAADPGDTVAAFYLDCLSTQSANVPVGGVIAIGK